MAVALQTVSQPLVHLSADFIRAKEYLEAIVTSTGDAICTTDTEGRILYFSPGAEAMLGLSSARATGLEAHRLYAAGRHEADRIMRLLRRQGSLQNLETVLKASDGRLVHVSMSASLLRDRAGKVIGTLGISKDITARVELERRLRELSITDNLTGLYNQRHFRDRLEQELSRARRQRGSLALVLIDLDGFKAVNDLHGHLEGDRLLARFADVLRRSVRREVDLVFRYGGDEFTALLPSTAARRAQTVARRIAARAEAELGAQGLGLSYGVASYPPVEGAAQLVRAADSRMYAMKARRKSARA